MIIPPSVAVMLHLAMNGARCPAWLGQAQIEMHISFVSSQKRNTANAIAA